MIFGKHQDVSIKQIVTIKRACGLYLKTDNILAVMNES